MRTLFAGFLIVLSSCVPLEPAPPPYIAPGGWDPPDRPYYLKTIPVEEVSKDGR